MAKTKLNFLDTPKDYFQTGFLLTYFSPFCKDVPYLLLLFPTAFITENYWILTSILEFLRQQTGNIWNQILA